jgi:hypothetical protein
LEREKTFWKRFRGAFGRFSNIIMTLFIRARVTDEIPKEHKQTYDFIIHYCHQGICRIVKWVVKKPLSKLLISILSAFKSGLQIYCGTCFLKGWCASTMDSENWDTKTIWLISTRVTRRVPPVAQNVFTFSKKFIPELLARFKLLHL